MGLTNADLVVVSLAVDLKNFARLVLDLVTVSPKAMDPAYVDLMNVDAMDLAISDSADMDLATVGLIGLTNMGLAWSLQG